MNVKMTLIFQGIIILCCRFMCIEAQTTPSRVVENEQHTSSEILLKETETNGKPHYSRIVGGLATLKEPYNYYVTITHLGKHLCSGTLLTEEWVLTAAHCITNEDDSAIVLLFPRDVDVILEITEISSEHYINCPVKGFLVHPDYTQHELAHDIGLIQLAHPCPQTNYSTLADNEEIESFLNSESEGCEIIGRGAIKEVEEYTSEISDRLLKAPVTLRKDACKDDFPQYSSSMNRQLCAYNEKIDFCTGDSGGPLICNEKQFGVLSSSTGCHQISAALYIRIDIYKQWIEGRIARSNTLTKLSYSVLCSILIINIFL